MIEKIHGNVIGNKNRALLRCLCKFWFMWCVNIIKGQTISAPFAPPLWYGDKFPYISLCLDEVYL